MLVVFVHSFSSYLSQSPGANLQVTHVNMAYDRISPQSMAFTEANLGWAREGVAYRQEKSLESQQSTPYIYTLAGTSSEYCTLPFREADALHLLVVRGGTRIIWQSYFGQSLDLPTNMAIGTLKHEISVIAS